MVPGGRLLLLEEEGRELWEGLLLLSLLTISNEKNEMKLECLGTYTTITIYHKLNSSLALHLITNLLA
jgi:hypothetical protein